MGHTPGYECDIFISYSHQDNTALPGIAGGWVDAFHEALENWLRHRRGFSNLVIWRDRELRGHTLFDLAIENRLKSSALFFALTSENYLRSEYCQKELRCFHRFGSARLGENSRLFNIILRNIPHAGWPPEMAGLSGFPMHDSQDEHRLGDFTSPKSEQFEKQLRPIVDAVEEMLRQSPAPASSTASGSGGEKKVRVFLADVADDLSQQRKRLAADLSLQGAEILKAVPPPWEGKEHEQELKSILAQADLCVHLLGRWPGRLLPDPDDATYPREQARIALASNTPQVIWLPEGLEIEAIEDEPYRALLKNLESGGRETKNFDLLRGTPSGLAEFLRQRIAGLRESAGPVPSQSVLIDTHQKDQSHAYKLADVLAQQGIDVDFNKESRDPTQSLSNFEDALRQVRNLVIMFGKVAPDWLEGRIKKALKIAAEQFDRDAPLLLENIWIFLLPASGGKVPLRKLPKIIHIDLLDNSHSDDIDPAVLSRFLKAQSDGTAG